MISRKTLAGLMAGASVSAILLAGMPAHALDVGGNQGAEYVVPVPLDELVLLPDFVVTGDVIVDGLIGAFGDVANPVEIQSGATIGGDFLITEDGTIRAFDGDVEEEDADATATAIVNDSALAPRSTNNGTISAEARAQAAADDDDATANANARAIEHDGTTLADDVNNGDIIVKADATATGIDGEEAHANADASGIDQFLSSGIAETRTAIITNGVDGWVSIHAEANTGVEDDDDGTADADAIAFEQTIRNATTGAAQATNEGYVKVVADAFGMADDDGAELDVEAEATGLNQDVEATGTGSATFTNIGSLYVEANAEIHDGGGDVDDSQADAEALGVSQDVESDGTATARIVNTSDDTLSVLGNAYITGGDELEAFADATGMEQETESLTRAVSELDNSGVLSATAKAEANGEDKVGADADARALEQDAESELVAIATVTNTGSQTAYAEATATGEDKVGATAEATGIDQWVSAGTDGTASVVNAVDAQIIAHAKAAAYLDNDDAGDVDASSTATAIGVSQQMEF